MDTNGTFCFRFEAFVVLAFSLSLALFLSFLSSFFLHSHASVRNDGTSSMCYVSLRLLCVDVLVCELFCNF